MQIDVDVYQNIFIAFLLLAIIIILIFFLRRKSSSEASYVKSSLDGKRYLTQNLKDKQQAAFILSEINNRILKLKNYLKTHINQYPEYAPYIQQFDQKIKGVVLQENAPNGQYTSYTINKGEEIVLCLRSNKDQQLHDINLIMYVVLHELAHVACPELNHTPLFKKIFVFLLRIAMKLDIYHYVNYQIDPHEYCGLMINEDVIKSNK